MESDCDYDTDCHSQAKKRKTDSENKSKKYYSQKYNSSWQKDPEFNGWVDKSSRGNNYFYCKICKTDNATTGGRSNLKKHASSSKHALFAREMQKQSVLNSDTFKKNTNESIKVKEAEIRMTLFAVEHNISFNTMDHFSQLIKVLCPDSKIAEKITCNRTKATKVIENVTGKYSFNQLVSLLQTTKFSLIVDESTDISSTKSLALVVRFYHNKRILDQFLALIKVENATAKALYETITQFFEKNKIPYKKNMLGFAADNASNMFADNNSLSQYLRKDIPNLFLMRCICHSFALCASKACETLPRAVEDTARDVHNYFNNSYKRLTELKEFQEFVNIKPAKILKLSSTRWLSLQSVVKRLLQQYDALILYFTKAVLEDKILAAETILKRLRDKHTLRYLQFLEFVLPFFNSINIEMQAESTKIHVLYSRIETIYKAILDCFLKPDYLKQVDIKNVDFENPHNFVSFDKMYLGAKISAANATDTLGLSESQFNEFKRRCLSFYISSCKEIRKRFNFKDDSVCTIKLLSALNPKEIQKYDSIAPLAVKFPNLVEENLLNDLDCEWRQLRRFQIEIDDSKSSIDFWLSISEIELGNNNSPFSILPYFMINLHCLPHSSASTERIFSQINLNKTKTRNRLDNNVLNGIMYTKDLIGTNNCYDLSLLDTNNKIFTYFNNSIYESNK